jgi:hypothetical protein
VESAGIPDLTVAHNPDQGRAVDLITDRVDSGGGRVVAAGGSRSALVGIVILKVGQVLVHIKAASNRLEVRIDEFTNHDDLIQRVEWVNDIWITASQCLTARVDA